MSKAGYNHDHWSKRIVKYLSEDWSREPSPFVQLAAKYIPENATVLELGAGAGQDGLWLATKCKMVTLTDAEPFVFEQLKERASASSLDNVDFQVLDLTKPFAFPDASFDVVYAQLVIHYFDNETTTNIMDEIKRVLKPGGVVACMVNSTNDPEYDAEVAGKDGLIEVHGLIKRYFNLDTFRQFTIGFELTVYDMEGRTPKDDAVKTSGMVQFIGRKND